MRKSFSFLASQARREERQHSALVALLKEAHITNACLCMIDELFSENIRL